MLGALVLAALLVGPAEPGQPQLSALPGSLSAPAAGTFSEPFSKLFSTPEVPSLPRLSPAPSPRRDASSSTRARSKVVCGTTLIIVGSQGDPQMVKAKPKDHTHYAMRRFPPPACSSEK
jgi:hypothetical protein